MSSQSYPTQPGIIRNAQPLSLALIREKIQSLIKRIFDIVAALIGLILLLPVFAYIVILIKRDSPGPIFFWGKRMGRNGKPFRILKFRTMYETLESYQGPPVTADKDNRITPLGHWLRDTKVNELPQLWNVLIGEMSLVGPRPEDIEIAKTWSSDAFNEILSVRPGITSPTSVLYHDEEKMLSQDNLMGDYLRRILPDKIRLDRLYVRHHSFFSDLDAIFWTIAIIVPRLSETKIPEGYIFAGPISRIFYRYVNWFLIDFLVSLIVAYMAELIWSAGMPVYERTQYLIYVPFLLALLFSGFNSVIGLNRVLWSDATLDDAIRLIISSIFMTVMIWAINYVHAIYRFFSIAPLSLAMILFIGIASGFGFLLTRYRLRILSTLAHRWVNWRQDSTNVGERILMVGLGDASRVARYLIKQQMFRNAFSIVGTVDDTNPSQHGMRVSGSWLLGGIKDIPALVKRHDIGVVLSTIPLHEPENELILELSQLSHTRLIFLDDLLSMADQQMTRPQGEIDSNLSLGGRLEYKAMHDVVTGLPNRYLMRDRIQHAFAYAKRYNTQPAFIFVELNEVIGINETFGNKISADVLRLLARRLESCKRESDTLARFGFDKFAFTLENVPTEHEVELIVQRVRASLSEPVKVGGQEYILNARIGHCLCQKTCGAFSTPNNIEVMRCYGCAMSKTIESRKETSHSYENILAK